MLELYAGAALSAEKSGATTATDGRARPAAKNPMLARFGMAAGASVQPSTF